MLDNTTGLSRRTLLILGTAALVAACGGDDGRYKPAPLPEDLAIQPAPEGVAPEAAAFLGVWEGTWGRRRNGKLAVTSVDVSGRADVVFAEGTSDSNFRAGHAEMTGQIVDGTLTLAPLGDGRTISYTIEDDGTMTGRSERDGIITSGRFTRQ